MKTATTVGGKTMENIAVGDEVDLEGLVKTDSDDDDGFKGNG